MEQRRPILVPLIIDGEECMPKSSERIFCAEAYGKHSSQHYDVKVYGADVTLCHLAVDSCARAFDSWKDVNPQQRRELFFRLADHLRERGMEIKAIMEEEIKCTPQWSDINLEDSILLIKETASLITPTMSGVIPHTKGSDSQALILTEPLGVILGIAPWNSPLILGLRAVIAPIAAGNTAILKGSELSPRTHHFIARLFQEVGFPPGVLNFLLHKEQEAAEIFQALIERREVRKCNFTGSTPVGRLIASQAARALKPVLLELGGKNYAIVLEDADLASAARNVVEGAFLNNGQICMSTDIVLVAQTVLEPFRKEVFNILDNSSSQVEITPVITSRSNVRIRQLLDDAKAKGAKLTEFPGVRSKAYSAETIIPATIIEDLNDSMSFYYQEAFGPLVGLAPIASAAEAAQIINQCSFGLSASIFTKNHFAALKLAKCVRVGAIHVNGATVHDESTLPHGGHGDSGWGRFGAGWGLQEFVQTKTVILNA